MSIGEIYNKIKPYIAKDFNLASVGGTITQVIQQLVPHALSGSYHTGVLSKTQAPWVATDIADAVTLHTSDEDAHHNKIHDIVGDTHTVTGNALDIVGLIGPNDLGLVVPSSNPGVNSKILKTDTAGIIEIEGVVTKSIEADDDLYINPTGNLYIDSEEGFAFVKEAVTIQTENFTSQTTGWRHTYAGELDTRYIFSDQMKIKKFIVDTEAALAGSEMITKSVSNLARDTYVPYPGFKSYIYVEDLQDGENMACFEANDFIRLSESSRSGGSFSSLDAWGLVTSYNDESDKQQRWNFTRSGSITINSITKRGENTHAGTNVTSFNVGKLSGTITGDLIIISALIDNIDAVITNAHGFLTYKEYIFGSLKMVLLYKIAGGSEPSSYTFSSDVTIDYNACGVFFRNALGIGEVGYSEFLNPTTNFTSGGVHNLSDYDYLLLIAATTGEPEYTEPALWTELIDFATGVGFSQGIAGLGGADNGFISSQTMTTDLSLTGFTLLIDVIPTYSGLNLTTGYLPPGSLVSKGETVLDYGISGNGYIESTTLDGAYGSNSPYIKIVTWTTHPTNKLTRNQLGHLKGIFSVANEYGLFAGDGATVNDKYLRLSSYTSVFNNIPIKMVTSSTERIRIDASYGIDLQLAASADTLTAITWRSSVGTGAPVVSIDAFDGGDSTQLIVDLDAISDSPTGVTIIRANNYGGTSTAELTLTAGNTSSNSSAILSGNAVGLGNSSVTNKITLRVKSTGYVLVDGDTRIVGGLDVSNTEEFMPDNGGLSVGRRDVNYSPTTGNWYTSGCTILLTGQNYSVIGFHDANERVDYIRVGQATMTLGYDGGWGNPYVSIPGGLVIGRGSNSAGALAIAGTAVSSHFNYDTGEDTYIRGGKINSKVIINDYSYGDVEIGGGGGATIIWSRLGTVWGGLSFGSGWANYGGAYQTGQIKKVGDFIFLRGLVYRFTGSGTVIATLPSGHRPPAQCLIGIHTNTGLGRIDIQTNGQIVLVGGGADWVSLDGIVFSIL